MLPQKSAREAAHGVQVLSSADRVTGAGPLCVTVRYEKQIHRCSEIVTTFSVKRTAIRWLQQLKAVAFLDLLIPQQATRRAPSRGPRG